MMYDVAIMGSGDIWIPQSKKFESLEDARKEAWMLYGWALYCRKSPEGLQYCVREYGAVKEMIP